MDSIPEPAWLRPAGAEPAQPYTVLHIAKGSPDDSTAHSSVPKLLRQQVQLPEQDSEPGPAWLRHADTQAMAVGAGGSTAAGLPADSPEGSGPADAMDPSGLASLLARLGEFQGPDGAPGTPQRGPAPGAAEARRGPAPEPGPEHPAAPAGTASGHKNASMHPSRIIAGGIAAARTEPHGMAATQGGISSSAAPKPHARRLASGAADLRERLELETLAHEQCVLQD